MTTLNLVHKVISNLPEWVYGRKWLIGLIVAMKIGLMLSKFRPGRFVA